MATLATPNGGEFRFVSGEERRICMEIQNEVCVKHTQKITLNIIFSISTSIFYFTSQWVI
jgi:hypothetical protein